MLFGIENLHQHVAVRPPHAAVHGVGVLTFGVGKQVDRDLATKFGIDPGRQIAIDGFAFAEDCVRVRATKSSPSR